jgi:hypothetical protein
MVMVEISPKVVLPTDSLTPIPSFLNHHIRTVHVRHIPSISKLSEFSVRPKGSLAHIISNSITVNINSENRVSHINDTSSPTFIEGLIRICVGSEVRIVVIEGTVKYLGMNDAGHWQFLSAGSVSKLRIASIARHSSNKTV